MALSMQQSRLQCQLALLLSVANCNHQCMVHGTMSMSTHQQADRPLVAELRLN